MDVNFPMFLGLLSAAVLFAVQGGVYIRSGEQRITMSPLVAFAASVLAVFGALMEECCTAPDYWVALLILSATTLVSFTVYIHYSKDMNAPGACLVMQLVALLFAGAAGQFLQTATVYNTTAAALVAFSLLPSAALLLKNEPGGSLGWAKPIIILPVAATTYILQSADNENVVATVALLFALMLMFLHFVIKNDELIDDPSQSALVLATILEAAILAKLIFIWVVLFASVPIQPILVAVAACFFYLRRSSMLMLILLIGIQVFTGYLHATELQFVFFALAFPLQFLTLLLKNTWLHKYVFAAALWITALTLSIFAMPG